MHRRICDRRKANGDFNTCELHTRKDTVDPPKDNRVGRRSVRTSPATRREAVSRIRRRAESTVTYTAATAITAGTIVTLTGLDLDAAGDQIIDNSTHTGSDYETSVTSGGPAVPVADSDIAISDDDGTDIFAAEIKIRGDDAQDFLAVNGSLPPGIVATAYFSASGILRLEGQALHAAYEAAIHQVEFSTTDTPGDLKHILISVYDGTSWSKGATAFINV